MLFHKLRSCGIAARKAGGKKGDELCGMRLALQRTPRYRPQRSPVCFPDQIHRKADAALYIKSAGMIMLRDRRIQPPLGKHRPIRSPGSQIYRIRDMKKPGAISSQTEPAQKPVYFPNVHGALRHLSVFNFCDLLPQGREQLFDLVLLQHEQKEHQRDRGKQYMPRSKSLYARPVMRSRSAISSCVSPLRLRSALTYPEKKLLSASLYNFIGEDLRFDGFRHFCKNPTPSRSTLPCSTLHTARKMAAPPSPYTEASAGCSPPSAHTRKKPSPHKKAVNFLPLGQKV